jgi:hypothetical protein
MEAVMNETGSLEKRPRERAKTKFHSQELADFVSKNPDATLEDISTHSVVQSREHFML